MSEILPSTDPYATIPEELNPDRLADKQTTPLMSGGASGALRICILLGLAGFMIHGKSKEQPISIELEFNGLRFPDEIKIAGSRQSILGGGAAPFGAVGVYTKMTPAQVTSPPSTEWAALDTYADAANWPPHAPAHYNGFFDALSALSLDKSILVLLDGRHIRPDFIRDLQAPLEAALDEAETAKVVDALTTAITDIAPIAGAQVYMTCDRKQVHVAYGGPADGDGVRNMAPVTATLANSACTALFGAFLGNTGVADSARQSVAKGFMEQFGRAAAGVNTHEEL